MEVTQVNVKRWTAVGFTAAISVGFAAGCGWNSMTNRDSARQEDRPASAIVSPVNTSKPDTNAHESGKIALSQSAGNQRNGKTSAIQPTESYSKQHPALFALTLSQTIEQVEKQYGKPAKVYDMNDGGDSITVYDYETFAAGFDRNRSLAYVEALSESGDPGLGGVKLGDKADAAVKSLGEPDIRTDYVLTYRTKATVLKLDMDPQSGSIQSIKLFGRTE
jgi:hypothetical protein